VNALQRLARLRPLAFIIAGRHANASRLHVVAAPAPPPARAATLPNPGTMILIITV
jgi:hypothetical protein